MSLFTTRNATDTHGFPRVSGDEPQSMTEPTADLMFSPRERG